VLAGCSLTFDDSGFLGGSAASAGGAAGSGAAGGGAGAGSGGEGGGSGGEAAGIAAADWTSSMLAVWRFDELDLGSDSVADHDLEILGVPEYQAGAGNPQGEAAVALLAADGFDGFSTEDPALEVAALESFTAGLWIRIDAAPEVAVEMVSRFQGNAGYSFDHTAGDVLECFVGDGVDMTSAATASGSFPHGEWIHVACSYDHRRGQIRGYLNGLLSASARQDAVAAVDSGSTNVVSGGLPMSGALDELFMVKQALDASALSRIVACNIDGSRCRCDATDPTQYQSCGGLAACRGLPPCNSTTP
jgi:hypothetical protein